MSTRKTKDFTVLYGTGKKEIIIAYDLLSAQKAAHKKAAREKTIVLRVYTNNL